MVGITGGVVVGCAVVAVMNGVVGVGGVAVVVVG